MSLFSRDFLSQFWWLYSPIRKHRMHALLKANKNNIVIHTPGKVGSTSVYVTLKKILGETHNVFHFHFLSKNAIDIMWKKNLASERTSVPLHLIESKHFTEKFDYLHNQITLIVLVREPINRYISATYQNLNMHFKEKHKADLSDINDLIFNGLREDEHLTELDWWFDQELKTHFNIDVYEDENLISADGYWFFERDNAKVYIIKMEELNDVFTQFCQRELNLNGVQLINSNVGKNKAYSSKYQQTKENLNLPDEIVQTLRASKFYKRFYSAID